MQLALQRWRKLMEGRSCSRPACNRVVTLGVGQPLNKTLQKSISLPTTFINTDTSSDLDSIVTKLVASSPKLKFSPPVSPKTKPAKAVLKQNNDTNGLNSSSEKPATPKCSTKSTRVSRKKSKKLSSSGKGGVATESSLFFSCDRTPGSIAAAQREQASLVQAQRKMRIAHYGRTTSKLEGKIIPVDSSSNATQEEKRCSFITPYSDQLYVAYHDEEWGVPVHDDKMLFELLVLSSAQVGLDWATILRKRNDFRKAFAEFDAEVVSKFTEREMTTMISTECGLDLRRVRGTIDNAKRILEVRKVFGTFDKYLWGFVNYKPISTNYKTCRKIPVKTSKSESISKDMVRRGFQFVSPTVVHSFMQAAGLTNDHIITCPRHLYCSRCSSRSTTKTILNF